MPLEINRPGDSAGEKPRLSSFGKRVLAIALILALLATALIYSRIQAGRLRAQLADQVLAAVERGKIVCANSLSAVGADAGAIADLQGFITRIDEAKHVNEKASVAQLMIGFCLTQVGGNQSQVDELNGARNRIILAVQQYNNPK